MFENKYFTFSTFQLLAGCSAITGLYPGISKLTSSDKILLYKKVSERHERSRWLFAMWHKRRDNLIKLCTQITFTFQWNREKLWQELHLGPWFSSTSPISLMTVRYNQIW